MNFKEARIKTTNEINILIQIFCLQLNPRLLNIKGGMVDIRSESFLFANRTSRRASPTLEKTFFLYFFQM